MRYSTVYGPRPGSSGFANVRAVFFNQIRQQQPLTIYGDGKQTRDFVYVGDIVRANILAAAQPAAVGEVCNIGTGRETNVNQMASIIDRISGKKNPVVYADARAGEVRQSRANIEKAKRVLGYSQETYLEEGVRLTWQEEMGNSAKGDGK